MIRIGTVYPYRYVHTRESELTLESGIIESCMNRLCRVQCVSYSELHGARRAESNRTCEDNDDLATDCPIFNVLNGIWDPEVLIAGIDTLYQCDNQ